MIFQISRRADYAVRIMLELGALPDGQRAHAHRIAEKTGVPLAFLRKIVLDLVKAGLARTYPGPTGGLRLAQPSADINVLQILEAADGPICFNSCLLRPKECPRDLICPAHGFWGRLQATVIHRLQSAKLDALVAEAGELKSAPRRPDIAYVYPEKEELHVMD